MKYLAAFLLMVGCSAPQAPDSSGMEVSWCFNTPDHDVAFFENAMTEWNQKTGVTNWKHDETNCQRFITMVDPGSPELYGHVAYSLHDIYYQSGMSDEEMKNLALHELGHIVNLPHSKDTTTIMYPSVGTGIIHLTQKDLNSFFEINWEYSKDHD